MNGRKLGITLGVVGSVVFLLGSLVGFLVTPDAAVSLLRPGMDCEPPRTQLCQGEGEYLTALVGLVAWILGIVLVGAGAWTLRAHGVARRAEVRSAGAVAYEERPFEPVPDVAPGRPGRLRRRGADAPEDAEVPSSVAAADLRQGKKRTKARRGAGPTPRDPFARPTERGGSTRNPLDGPRAPNPLDAPRAGNPLDAPRVPNPLDAPRSQNPLDATRSPNPLDSPSAQPEVRRDPALARRGIHEGHGSIRKRGT